MCWRWIGADRHPLLKTRDVHLRRFLARPDAGIDYSITGPVELQLALRPYHQEPGAQVINDWIELAVADESRWLPLTDSRASSRIRQVSSGAPGAMGKRHRVTLRFGPGEHRLRVRPADHPVLVDAQLLAPAPMASLVRALQQPGPAMPANVMTAADVLGGISLSTLADCGGSGGDAVLPAQRWIDYATLEDGSSSSFSAAHTLADLSLPLTPREAGRADVERYLLLALWHWPGASSERRRGWIAQGNALAASHPLDARIDRLLRALNRDYRWQLEEQLTGSAGSRRVATSATVESPALVARERMLAPDGIVSGQRLTGHGNIGFFTRFRQPTRVRLTLRQGILPYHQAPPAEVQVSLGGDTVTRIAMPPQRVKYTLEVPAGEQKIRLSLREPSSDHWLYVDAEARLDGGWVPLVERQPRRFDVATAEQPVEIYIDEPRWLRIDEYRGDTVSHRHYLQSEPGILRLTPAAGLKRAYYRVSGWRPRARPNTLLPYEFTATSAVVPYAAAARIAPLAVSAPAETASYRWLPEKDTAVAVGATDGAYVQFELRRDFDADAPGDDERFVEAGWRHRDALDCAGCYWRSDLFAREHTEDDNRVIGTRQWLRGTLPRPGWRWETRQSLLLQLDPDVEWSWGGSLSAVHRLAINEKMASENSLQLFGRYLSADDPEQPVDNDIFTDYKDRHRYGARLGSVLRGSPWLDSRWVVDARISTNEDFNPLQPDYLQAGAAWRQFFTPVAVSAGFRHRYYLDDDDRSGSSHSPLLQLALDSRHGIGERLLNFNGRVDYDPDRNEFSVRFGVGMDLTRGRGLLDYDPVRTGFHGLFSRDLQRSVPAHQLTEQAAGN
ncbi:MAG: hypothetical protein R3228_10700 [Halioglobus sp.]|nr:hypothetical protein [Halioglobus sp.]